MQLRVKPSLWITTSGLSPPWTLSTARIRISYSVLWPRARASRRFMPHYTLCLLTYELVNTSLSASAGTASVKVEVTAPGLPIKEALDLLLLAKGLFDGIQNLKSSPPPELSAADKAAFSAEIGTSLVDLLIGDYLAIAFPTAFNLL